MSLLSLRHTFRAVWPLPASPRPDKLLNESLDRLDKTLDERASKHSVDPVASMIDGMFDR
jgi:hypothetical protein